ncbi:gliding motility-associated C-terminal domain-containing protein [Chryseobacterium sp. CFBP8996]|uniref:T9SS type B sorting domain-containing protein n=1 Tax=Chryseobacterium sp. CFBP8996 TaxID=3096529 RepID=UPI002A69AE82|nr:gliding motility-associated C-terminal domain-containing protein [Chryseobacterium sp. CFBP8996]MDY0933062.1 gliding motility-associated C-terminal domain-containing protein [Chryseobacterium sp. CFBP8996]
MKKLLFYFIPIFLFNSMLFAQRDTDHWFAPYFDSSATNYIHAIYLSTDSVTPFQVRVYNNNVQIGAVTISKGSPQVFNVPANLIKTSVVNNAATVRTLGLYTKGDLPYFATLRIYSQFHGEVITSKGKAGIGRFFYNASAPLTHSAVILNFTTGILATEDDTTVTVSNFDNGVQFINVVGTPNSITFTLNKGESYILAGKSDFTPNWTGFIGAKIVADKPVSITNGNANGYYATVNSGGSDLILDQSVPTTRLGSEFAMVRSTSTSPVSYNMEGGIIVAPENDTQIFLNNNLLPIATINEGDFYRIRTSAYVNQGQGHFNLRVRTSKNVYLYQLVASQGVNTGGYNYIPPLNCYLPKNIDEVGLINQMPSYSGTINLKLNIITELGANITVNGVTPNSTQGPFPLSGSTQWVTYALQAVSGNLTINSDRAITAGINGGYPDAGYGGFFAGFSSLPAITRLTGECIPGIVLRTPGTYDMYQWYFNGAIIPGATNNTFTPTQAGVYSLMVSAGGCTPIMTANYKVYTCLYKSSKVSTICESSTNIAPQFSVSQQSILNSSVQIISQPSNGTAVIDPITGVITYTPNVGFLGADTFVYKFCGSVQDFQDCEEITHTITVAEAPVVNNAVLRVCAIDGDPLNGLFNLTTASVNTQLGTIKTYFTTYNNALNNTSPISLASASSYISPNGTVFIRVGYSGGCFKIAEVQLVVIPLIFSKTLTDKIICSGSTTNLDAGSGFDSYEWSTGATTSMITNVGIGSYWVKLKSGECTVQQTVNVIAASSPVITSVEIQSNGFTVFTSGGHPPYEYSIDGITWSTSNVFTNVQRGHVTVYVRDSYGCIPVEYEFFLPNIINAISPNGDGYNDILNYSGLSVYSDFKFEVYNRYGELVFLGNKNNNFTWDGTINKSLKLNTGTYWYVLSWKDVKNKNVSVEFKGWVLLKNRD